jgi:hypothetical protein
MCDLATDQNLSDSITADGDHACVLLIIASTSSLPFVKCHVLMPKYRMTHYDLTKGSYFIWRFMVSKVASQKEKRSVSRLFQAPNCLNPGEEEKKCSFASTKRSTSRHHFFSFIKKLIIPFFLGKVTLQIFLPQTKHLSYSCHRQC